jgi:hypothetical protein
MVRSFVAPLLACAILVLAACGGGTSSSSSNNGPISGNWQIDLSQERPPAQFAVSGFLLQSNNSLTGSVARPGQGCAGPVPLTGTVSGQNVVLSVNSGTMSLTGSVSSDGKSMSGVYQTLPQDCTRSATTGTWTALQVPPLNVNFTGTLPNSLYMQLVTGLIPPAPIMVSGSLSQSGNIGSVNATLTGTINAVDYPCFSTASLNGTVSGTSVVLSVFSFDGTQIGSIGVQTNPAILSVGPTGTTLNGIGSDQSGQGLTLGTFVANQQSGPCPKLIEPGVVKEDDFADVALMF